MHIFCSAPIPKEGESILKKNKLQIQARVGIKALPEHLPADFFLEFLYCTLSLEHSRWRDRSHTEPYYHREGPESGALGSSILFIRLPFSLFQSGNKAGALGVHLVSQLVVSALGLDLKERGRDLPFLLVISSRYPGVHTQ